MKIKILYLLKHLWNNPSFVRSLWNKVVLERFSSWRYTNWINGRTTKLQMVQESVCHHPCQHAAVKSSFCRRYYFLIKHGGQTCYSKMYWHCEIHMTIHLNISIYCSLSPPPYALCHESILGKLLGKQNIELMKGQLLSQTQVFVCDISNHFNCYNWQSSQIHFHFSLNGGW